MYVVWPCQAHRLNILKGFMVRGDYANKPEVKKNREQAFAKSIEFLQKQL